MTGCFQTRHLSYSGTCDMYYYKGIPLRLPDGRIVTSHNIDTFLMMAQVNYLLQSRMTENDLWISRSDQLLVKLYDSAMMSISNENYVQTLDITHKLCHSYANMSYFSDIHFVQGYAWQKLGMHDSARVAFIRFLNYAGSKYPGRFRGLSRKPEAIQQFCDERRAAMNFLHNDTLLPINFPRIAPNYYFQSLSPGYGYNPDDFKPNTRWIFSGIGWETMAGQQFFQTNILYVPHNRLGVATGINLNKNIQLFYVGFPWQTAWAKNRRWGLKITPIIYLAHNNFTGSYRMIPVAGLSIGYHVLPRYYIGFRTGIPHKIPAEWQPYFNQKQWSISANAHLIKNLSITLTLLSLHDIITGIMVNNTILGYNWRAKQLFLSLQIF
ncbi:MAG: hypothetical protein ACP5PS_05340 [Bacteroidales bacterium]